MESFTIASLNTCHSASLTDATEIIRKTRPKIFFLQECVLNTDQLNTLFSRYDYTSFSSLNINERPGVGVIYQNKIKIKDIHVLEPGRLLLLTLENNLSFLNVYAPAGNQKRMERNYLFSNTVFRNISFKNQIPMYREL